MLRARVVVPSGLVLFLFLAASARENFAAVSQAPDRPVTFNKDIAPIVFQQCSPCHRPGGTAAFPLLTYEDARARSQLISDAAERRYMPPWMASARECGGD